MLTPLPPEPDGPPMEVLLEAVTSQSIRVTWKVNAKVNEGCGGSVKSLRRGGFLGCPHTGCALLPILVHDYTTAEKGLNA